MFTDINSKIMSSDSRISLRPEPIASQSPHSQMGLGIEPKPQSSPSQKCFGTEPKPQSSPSQKCFGTEPKPQSSPSPTNSSSPPVAQQSQTQPSLFAVSSQRHSQPNYNPNQIKILEALHSKALQATKKYKQAESELLTALEEVREKQVHLYKGYRSIYEYATKCLGLSEGIAYSLHAVLKKSDDVPELKTQVQSGTLSLTAARRVVAVINPTNKDQWIEKAKILPQRALEYEVAKENPKAAVPTREKFVAADLVDLRFGIAQKDLMLLKRAQDLLSQKMRSSIDLPDTICKLAAYFVDREDPLQKALRSKSINKAATITPNNLAKNEAGLNIGTPNKAVPNVGTLPANETALNMEMENESGPKIAATRTASNKLNSQNAASSISNNSSPRHFKSTKRYALPAAVKHYIYMRDKGQCTFEHENGSRCDAKRFLDIHHVVPLSQGGLDTVENLKLLCATHHKREHKIW